MFIVVEIIDIERPLMHGSVCLLSHLSSGPLLSFDVNDNTAFEIPLSNVSQCATGKNEVTLEFHQNDDTEVSLMEVRFYVPPSQADERQESVEVSSRLPNTGLRAETLFMKCLCCQCDCVICRGLFFSCRLLRRMSCPRLTSSKPQEMLCASSRSCSVLLPEEGQISYPIV